MSPELRIDARTAGALSLTRLDHGAVAERLAEIGGLARPARAETGEFLVDVLASALSAVPASGAAWSWGEFHNRGLQPLYSMNHEEDLPRLGVCALDLGLGARPRVAKDGTSLTPLDALAGNLVDATEGLLAEVRELLEAAGVSP